MALICIHSVLYTKQEDSACVTLLDWFSWVNEYWTSIFLLYSDEHGNDFKDQKQHEYICTSISDRFWSSSYKFSV